MRIPATARAGMLVIVTVRDAAATQVVAIEPNAMIRRAALGIPMSLVSHFPVGGRAIGAIR